MTTILLLGRVCRTCLKKSKDMHKLREFIEDDIQIEDMLNQSIPNFDLQMDDVPLPVEICEECLSILQKTYEFVQICWKSNQELKNILNQQEQEIEASMVGVTSDVNPKDILEDTDLILVNDASPDYQFEAVKLEVEIINKSQHEDSSSSESYWPNHDEEDSESNSTKNITKASDIKLEGKCCRKVAPKRGHTNICLHCNKVFAKKKYLSKHLFVHDPVYLFVCDICSYRFSSERKLRNHINEEHTSVQTCLDGGPYACPDCPLIFQQSLDLSIHRALHTKNKFKCQVCNMYLKTLAHINTHMSSKHPDVLPYKCHVCDKAFPLENHLKYHINEHMGYKNLKCDLCEKSFLNITALKDHVRIHTGELPFLCPHCGKSFKTSNILRLHIQRHGEKKFNCLECPMKFYVQSKLNEHMSSHTKLKPHVCDICGKTFTRSQSLKSHKFAHSGERPFKCEVCNMSFVFKRHWKRHKITHTGEKPYMCSFCDRAYAASGDLVKHLRTHVGEKTYFCAQCPEAFKYAIDLKDHKLIHYKETLNLQQNNETAEICNETQNTILKP